MVDEAIEKMIKQYPKDKFIMKMLEECAELSEVLLKTLTKAEGYKPPLEKIIEEMGDVLFRAKALSRKLGIDDEVEARFQEKGVILNNYLTEKV